jgi:nitrogen regulatory protein P-II 1
MYYMVIFVVNHPDECGEILEAWEAIGTPGITILESFGLGQLRKQALRDDLPIMPNLQDLLKSKEIRHRTLFSVVEGEDKVDEILKATEKVVGNLDEENTGILFALPVSKVYGLRKPKFRKDQE